MEAESPQPRFEMLRQCFDNPDSYRDSMTKGDSGGVENAE